MTKPTCGTCRHTQPVLDNLANVTCFGHGVYLISTPQGVAPVRPQLPKTDQACGVWAAKDPLIITGANDAGP